jgi:acetyl esterase/lipase
MKRSTVSVFCFACLCVALPVLGADGPKVVPLWPGKPPEETGNIGAEKTLLSRAQDRKTSEVTQPTRLITNVTAPTITIRRPPKDKDTGAAMLICPGGGYWNLYWEVEGEEVADWLNSIGVTGILLKYRVPRYKDEVKTEPAKRPLMDSQRAVSLVRSRAKEWGIDPNRIGIVGFSAGGHLSIATATNFDKRSYEPVDEVDKVSCRPDFAVALYSGYLQPKGKEGLSPSIRIPRETPPVFLAHGGADVVSLPDNSVLMYQALKKAGIPTELHVYANSAHGFGVRPSERTHATWTRSCADWLRQQGFLTPKD